MADRQPLILIVEDEQDLREVLSRLLSQGGYRCELAEDGQVGLEMVQAKWQAARDSAEERKKVRAEGGRPALPEPEGKTDAPLPDTIAPKAPACSSWSMTIPIKGYFRTTVVCKPLKRP